MDSSIWNFDLSEFNTDLDFVISVDSGFDTNHS